MKIKILILSLGIFYTTPAFSADIDAMSEAELRQEITKLNKENQEYHHLAQNTLNNFMDSYTTKDWQAILDTFKEVDHFSRTNFYAFYFQPNKNTMTQEIKENMYAQITGYTTKFRTVFDALKDGEIKYWVTCYLTDQVTGLIEYFPTYMKENNLTQPPEDSVVETLFEQYILFCQNNQIDLGDLSVLSADNAPELFKKLKERIKQLGSPEAYQEWLSTACIPAPPLLPLNFDIQSCTKSFLVAKKRGNLSHHKRFGEQKVDQNVLNNTDSLLRELAYKLEKRNQKNNNRWTFPSPLPHPSSSMIAEYNLLQTREGNPIGILTSEDVFADTNDLFIADLFQEETLYELNSLSHFLAEEENSDYYGVADLFQETIGEDLQSLPPLPGNIPTPSQDRFNNAITEMVEKSSIYDLSDEDEFPEVMSDIFWKL